MSELERKRVETERRRFGVESLCLERHFPVGKVNRITADWQAELPQVNADLVRAPGQGIRLDQSRSVAEAFENTELGARRQSCLVIDFAGAIVVR